MGKWNCKLCNCFVRDSHTGCDWLIQTLNDKLCQNADAEIDVDQKLAWNPEGERPLVEVGLWMEKITDMHYCCIQMKRLLCQWNSAKQFVSTSRNW